MITKSQKRALVKAAKTVLTNEYATKNNGNYGAAVLTKAGNIYAGVSYFSDTYTLTAHGEQAALIHAASHSEGEIVAIAVSSKEDKKPVSLQPLPFVQAALVRKQQAQQA